MPLKNTNNKFLSISSDSIEDDFPIIGIGASFGAASTFTPGNGYEYVVYTSPGVMTIERGGFVDILLVAGGGGGGNFTNVFFPDSTSPFNPTRQGRFGGGGGAGGCLELFNYPLPIGTHQVSIGAGGVGGPVDSSNPYIATRGTNGTPSTFSNPAGEFTTLTAYGGGGGGGSDSNGSPLQPGINGGSGGGAAAPGPPSPGGTGNRVTAGTSSIPVLPQQISPQGNSGASTVNPPYAQGGGGGGWGAAGGTNLDITAPQRNASGGPGGRVWSGDTGLPTDYGTPGPDAGRYFGGGGGSGPGNASSNGGVGGGGGGSLFDITNPYTTFPTPAPNGGVNTGGGGGSGSVTVGSGGSGVFIMRYKA